ncbi:response regulator [Vibrio sp. SCSIO 43137]|uniref:response regulator n=1 Tax=Vibrio sp. SCSIO 43137 TaxID=3021011 RepID=UPI0023081B54|nr:response regulator [Vibrio sp. SCSIO 43137]WCE31798.1 response regulator [Vibrio sp. SCSIO 43137]
MIKVALIDDHVIVRSGFAQLLSLESDIQVSAEYSSAVEAFDRLKSGDVDICILDISMPDKSGLELLQEVSAYVRCIMLSVHDSATVIDKALKLGAKGFLSKRCSPDEMILAVRTVAKNKQYIPSDLSKKLANSVRSDNFRILTKRELEVGELLAHGLDIKKIAETLGLSPKTVHIHRANAMNKLNVTNNVELAKCFESEWI